MEEQKSFFDQLSPKSALLVGLVGGVLALGTIGFVILLSLMLKNGGVTLAGNNYVAPAPTVNDQGTQPTAPTPTAGTPVNVGVGHLPPQGNKNAKVTIIEFADFRCPFCERFFNDAAAGFIKDYVKTGKAVFYFRHFAFLGPESTLTSEAAECANDQGKFWQMHDWLFQHQASESDLAYYSRDNLIKYAGQVGLNVSKFTTCLNSHKFTANVTKDVNEGQAAGVNGTPTLFINGVPLVGAQPYASVKAAIEAALAK